MLSQKKGSSFVMLLIDDFYFTRLSVGVGIIDRS